MSRAITLASSWTEPGASEITMSNTLKTLISIVMKTTLSTGQSCGTVTRWNTCHSVAPSVRAASSVSREIDASPAAITTIAKPAQIQTYANMIEGVISFSPSHEMPRNGSANVSAPIATWYWPCSSSANSKVPSSAVDALSTSSPSASSSSTVTPGIPSSLGSTSPGVPPAVSPPVLKSLQTTPLMPPWSGSGCTAWTAPSGTSAALIPVNPSSAVLPVGTLPFSSSPPSGVGARSAVAGFASARTPGGFT